jgi:hypothetical protein
VFWLALYIAAMFCVALPVALFAKNEVAGVVFAVWAVGQVAYQIGLPEPKTQIALYGMAFAFILYERRRQRMRVPDGSLVAVALFVPLLLVCCLWAKGTVSESEAWWGIWWVAMLQAAFLLRPVAWAFTVRRWLQSRAASAPDSLLMVAL